MKKLLLILSLLAITACSQKQPVELNNGFSNIDIQKSLIQQREDLIQKSKENKLENPIILKEHYNNVDHNIDESIKDKLEKKQEFKPAVREVSIKDQVAKLTSSYQQVQADLNAVDKSLKLELKQRLEEQQKLSALIKKIKDQSNQVSQVIALKPETAVLEPVEDLEPLHKEITFSEKIYNATLKPVKLQILKWNAFVNKQVSSYMKQLKNNPSIWIILVSVFAAFTYGILHTLGPGHGKMVVATYFLTNNAKIWQGVLVGLQTAFAHVAGAIVLIFITDISLRNFILNPEQHMYLLKNISFALIMFIGLIMFTQAVLHALGKAKTSCAKCCGHSHTQHSHTHSHKKFNKKESLIALTIGCVPCTGSLLILLYAMANDMLIYGIIMVLFVAFGMALTMILIGILAILGKKHLVDEYLSETKHSHKYAIGIEFLGAVFIITIGSVLLFANL